MVTNDWCITLEAWSENSLYSNGYFFLIQGMEDRLLSGGTSTEEQSLPQEEGQLIEVLKTDTQVLYICQNMRGT